MVLIMNRPQILLKINDADIRARITPLLRTLGICTVEVTGAQDFLNCAARANTVMAIIELEPQAPYTALEVVETIRQIDKRFPIILVTHLISEELAVSALRAGVKDYFKYPFSEPDFIASVRLHTSNIRNQPYSAEIGLDEDYREDNAFVGTSDAMVQIKQYLNKVGRVDSNVLITGETGTGKEMAALYIHRSGPRRQFPFMAINCAALPDGILESELFGYEKGAFTGAQSAYAGKLRLADGGTVFLDEIGDMSLYAQAKILRVMESREVYPLAGRKGVTVDIRFIAATNKDLAAMVANKAFRQDLFFRLNVASVHLPPLRQRKEDIPLLIRHCIEMLNKKFGQYIRGVDLNALQAMNDYSWPGNVRELKNMLEAIYIDPPETAIGLQNLPADVRGDELKQQGESGEKERLCAVLEAVNWNKSQAAKQLCWSRMTLYRKMAKYSISNK